MAKIYLKESELRNLIESSIKKILTELDWKTYMNASRKAYNNDEIPRSNRFEKAAEKSYRDKYDTSKRMEIDSDSYNDFYLMHPVSGTNAHTQNSYTDDNDNINTVTTAFGRFLGPKVHSYLRRDNKDNNRYRSYTTQGKTQPKVQERPTEYNDVLKYNNGTTRYVKGKGWNI